MDLLQPPGPDVAGAYARLGRIALADHTLESVMTTVAELAAGVVPGTDEASVTLVGRGGRATSVAASGAFALALDERQYARGEGPCLEAATTGEEVLVRDMGAETRWPAYATAAAEAGAGSSLCLPVPVAPGTTASLNLYSRRHDAFDDAATVLGRTFASYAGVALVNMHLHESQTRLTEQLRTALASRAVIDQAKGILMGARHCSADEAFAILVDLSQHANRKLRDVAEALVADAVRRR